MGAIDSDDLPRPASSKVLPTLSSILSYWLSINSSENHRVIDEMDQTNEVIPSEDHIAEDYIVEYYKEEDCMHQGYMAEAYMARVCIALGFAVEALALVVVDCAYILDRSLGAGDLLEVHYLVAGMVVHVVVLHLAVARIDSLGWKINPVR